MQITVMSMEQATVLPYLTYRLAMDGMRVIRRFCNGACDNRSLQGFEGIELEKGTPGFYPGQKIRKLGCRGTVTGELILDNVRIPKENLLGEEGKGIQQLQEILDEIRTMTGAMALGIARAAYDEVLEFSRKRVAFGHPIGHYQLIRAKFANGMALEYSPQRHFRDARFLLYGGGTHEVLRDYPGRLIIGKV